MKVNVGCGPHYAQGWVNTDLVVTDQIRPDVVVTSDDPLPFGSGSVERMYLGHVLEHIPWTQIPAFCARVIEVCQPGAEVMVVGPDAVRTLERWRDGEEDWGAVAAVIEGTGAYLAHLGAYTPIRWDGDRHHWNCYEARVVEALTACGFHDVTPLGVLDDGRLDESAICGAGWPLVDASPRQFAVSARCP